MSFPPATLTPLEVASGLVLGLAGDSPARSGEEPREAFERALVPALRRPPCLVSFSGGRDSSAVLAAATAVARREGLPPPIPATNRFAGAPASREDEWQERVVSHLGLDDWVRLEHRDELDCVGVYAQTVLRRHGLLWPFNAHFHLPLLEAASGGSLLTGVGGDELLGDSSWARQLDLLRGRVRPERRDVLRLAHFAAPRALRAARLSRRVPLSFAWLRPSVRAEVARRWARHAAGEPRRPRAHVAWRSRLRYLRVGGASLALLAAAADVTLVHPFLDERFVAALASRRRPFPDRTPALEALFGDVLPGDVLRRSSKSSFDEAFFAAPSRSFAAAWDGEGVDQGLVNPEALAAEWSGARPDPRSYLLLQAAWLAGSSGAHGREEQLARPLEGVPAAGAAQLEAREGGKLEDPRRIARRHPDAAPAGERRETF
jgi:hypothetical protein